MISRSATVSDSSAVQHVPAGSGKSGIPDTGGLKRNRTSEHAGNFHDSRPSKNPPEDTLTPMTAEARDRADRNLAMLVSKDHTLLEDFQCPHFKDFTNMASCGRYSVPDKARLKELVLEMTGVTIEDEHPLSWVDMLSSDSEDDEEEDEDEEEEEEKEEEDDNGGHIGESNGDSEAPPGVVREERLEACNGEKLKK